MRPIRTQYATNTHRIRIEGSSLNCWLARLSAPKSNHADPLELQDRLGMYDQGFGIQGPPRVGSQPWALSPGDLGLPGAALACSGAALGQRRKRQKRHQRLGPARDHIYIHREEGGSEALGLLWGMYFPVSILIGFSLGLHHRCFDHPDRQILGASGTKPQTRNLRFNLLYFESRPRLGSVDVLNTSVACFRMSPLQLASTLGLRQPWST